ncbi:NAD(P)-binding domain-containing protein [Arenicella xantha]|uniref:Cyclic nucleotide-binding protein n=1 Tax=Arenicella xantha TaxID=644221 RepID=A0A395JKA2_9GAMM|nr:NAD(P)-binding domain-containing protein [Arenicella xantha]RBP47137.1 cyclic nucleotide-binding protein [Arenicella xantha]
MELFDIAVVGSGPGGMSAAAHAAELGVSHVLLEGSPKHSNTIQKYQKGKHVMDTPARLPLRSPLKFTADTRENILDEWYQGLSATNTNIRYNSEVSGIEGSQGNFVITTTSGDKIGAKSIILGIGVQGNPRKLPCPGADFEHVQYQLDDPAEYNDERIAVVGAGDAAIENAIGLADRNHVTIINRKDEFARAKQGNLDAIMGAISDGKIDCQYESNPGRIELNPDDESRYLFVLNTPTGEVAIPVDRVIARLGAIPPRKLVESFGIEFPNDNPASLPELSAKYESNVNGIYVIGALGGYPLIKQAMNQGYEVVEYILGNDIEPADHPLLVEAFKGLPYDKSVAELLVYLQQSSPIYRDINPLTFREFILDSKVQYRAPGDELCVSGEFTDTFFVVIDGNAFVSLPGVGEFHFNRGGFFGEQSLISGRRRTATVYAGEGCVVVETPRRTMVKLLSSVDEVKRVLDEAFILRALHSKFTPNTPHSELTTVVQDSGLKMFDAGEDIYTQGTSGDEVHLIRVGSVTSIKQAEEHEVITSYLPVGHYFGEAGALGDGIRTDTVRANVRTETICLSKNSFLSLLEKDSGMRQQVQAHVRERLTVEAKMEAEPRGGELMSFFMREGLGEGTDVLLIDESLCVGCDNCEKACAETHDGNSRLDREAGASFASIHVPISCRHCEHPHCMKDCPPDAIHRASDGEVFIDQEACIGCGNCVRNCPYEVISLETEPAEKPGLLHWLLTGKGPGPGGKQKDPSQDIKKAVKCDACKDRAAGPACVSSCPTGAAMRLNPKQFVDLVSSRVER